MTKSHARTQGGKKKVVFNAFYDNLEGGLIRTIV